MGTKMKVFLGILAVLTAFNTLVSYRYLEFRVESAPLFTVVVTDMQDRLADIQAKHAKVLADQASKAAEAAKPDQKK